MSQWPRPRSSRAPPRSPQPHLGPPPPQPVPPAPPASLSILLFLCPAPLSGDMSPGAPVLLRLLRFSGSWMSLSPCSPVVSMCLSMSAPQPAPFLFSLLSSASHLRVPIFLLLGVPELHIRVRPAPLVWAPRKATQPPNPAAALSRATARGLVCEAHVRVPPASGLAACPTQPPPLPAPPWLGPARV